MTVEIARPNGDVIASFENYQSPLPRVGERVDVPTDGDQSENWRVEDVVHAPPNVVTILVLPVAVVSIDE